MTKNNGNNQDDTRKEDLGEKTVVYVNFSAAASQPALPRRLPGEPNWGVNGTPTIEDSEAKVLAWAAKQTRSLSETKRLAAVFQQYQLYARKIRRKAVAERLAELRSSNPDAFTEQVTKEQPHAGQELPPVVLPQALVPELAAENEREYPYDPWVAEMLDYPEQNSGVTTELGAETAEVVSLTGKPLGGTQPKKKLTVRGRRAVVVGTDDLEPLAAEQPVASQPAAAPPTPAAEPAMPPVQQGLRRELIAASIKLLQETAVAAGIAKAVADFVPLPLTNRQVMLAEVAGGQVVAQVKNPQLAAVAKVTLTFPSRTRQLLEEAIFEVFSRLPHKTAQDLAEVLLVAPQYEELASSCSLHPGQAGCLCRRLLIAALVQQLDLEVVSILQLRDFSYADWDRWLQVHQLDAAASFEQEVQQAPAVLPDLPPVVAIDPLVQGDEQLLRSALAGFCYGTIDELAAYAALEDMLYKVHSTPLDELYPDYGPASRRK